MMTNNQAFPQPSNRDWTEDFDHENGSYANTCVKCDKSFMGHKHRVICKSCQTGPKRIQRKRTRGWRKPDNTISVCRPGKWGNPFKVGQKGPLGRKPIDNEGAVGFFEDMLKDPEIMAITGYPDDLSELKGKNLMCFCSLDSPCHADVLLRIANE